MTQVEEWRPVVGFEGCYEVSSFGRVRSIAHEATGKNGRIYLRRGKIMNLVDGNGKGHYKSVTLFRDDGYHKKVLVHRIVAEAFLPNPEEFKEINHKDEDKNNNRVDNLEWCDRKYNNTYGTLQIRKSMTRGRGVLQLKDGQIINGWPTASMAAAYTRTCLTNLRRCCNGKQKTAGGHEWQWAPWG